jgi:hypothetical protein
MHSNESTTCSVDARCLSWTEERASVGTGDCILRIVAALTVMLDLLGRWWRYT